MSQKVEIGVTANTGGAEGGINKVEGAAAGAQEAVKSIGGAADASGRKLDDLAKKADNVARAVKEIVRAREFLSQEAKRAVSDSDVAKFLDSFDAMRTKKVFGAGRAVLESNGFEDWLDNHQRRYTRSQDAMAHRRRVVAYGLPGAYDAPPAPPGQPPAPPPPGGGNENFQGGVQRAQSMAMAFGKSMLALAGINSVMGMASKAVDLATEEAVGLDTLKRRSGDLGVSFDKLQDQVRSAGDGLGITYVESVRLAQQYAKLTGQFQNAEGVKSGMGLSRAFGLDPTEGVQFFGTMQRLKVQGTDEQGSRRLALMIGEAVAKSGYPGKVDELISAVANYAMDISRQTLSAPNVGDYAGYLTTLMRSGYVGTSPEGSAGILNAADQAARRGGNMGDASKNFMFAALRNANPGMDVFQVQAMIQGGLFGTTANTFGSGTPLGDLWGRRGIKMSGRTNLQNYMALAERMYGGNIEMQTDAMANTFGLSQAQAAAFIQMSRRGGTALDDSQKLIASAGLDPSKLSATGIYGIGKLASAHDAGSLRRIYQQTMGRSDLSAADRSALESAMGSGNSDTLRNALAKVIGTNNQEETDGDKTRESITGLENTLTRVGGGLIEILNPIRTAVEVMAQSIAPEAWKRGQQEKLDRGVDFRKRALDSGVPAGVLDRKFAEADKMFRLMGGTSDAADKLAPLPNPALAGVDQWAYNQKMALRQHLRSQLARGIRNNNPGNLRSWGSAAVVDGFATFGTAEEGLSAMAGNLVKYGNDGYDTIRKIINRWAPSGDKNNVAAYIAAMVRRTGFGADDKLNMRDRAVVEKLMNGIIQQENGANPYSAKQLDVAASGRLGLTPLPDGAAATAAGYGGQTQVGFHPAEVTIKDSSGKHIGSTTLKPFVQQASGVGAPWAGVGVN